VEVTHRERKAQRDGASVSELVPVFLTQPMAAAPLAAVQRLFQQHLPRLRLCAATPMRAVLVEALSHSAMSFFEGAACEVLLQVYFALALGADVAELAQVRKRLLGL
jgi:hypothetical protein